jgi:hypothetical protein
MLLVGYPLVRIRLKGRFFSQLRCRRTMHHMLRIRGAVRIVGGIHAGTPRSRPDVDGSDPSLKKGLVVAMLAERASKNKAEADK